MEGKEEHIPIWYRRLSPESTGRPEKEKAAVIAGEIGRGIVDAEKYTESWEEAAELFRNAIKQ